MIIEPALMWLIGVAGALVTTLISVFLRSVITRLAGIDGKLDKYLVQTTELTTEAKATAKRLDRLEDQHFKAVAALSR